MGDAAEGSGVQAGWRQDVVDILTCGFGWTRETRDMAGIAHLRTQLTARDGVHVKTESTRRLATRGSD